MKIKLFIIHERGVPLSIQIFILLSNYYLIYFFCLSVQTIARTQINKKEKKGLSVIIKVRSVYVFTNCLSFYLSTIQLSIHISIFQDKKRKQERIYLKNYPTPKCGSIHPTIYPSIYSIYASISQSKEMTIKERDVLSNIILNPIKHVALSKNEMVFYSSKNVYPSPERRSGHQLSVYPLFTYLIYAYIIENN